MEEMVRFDAYLPKGVFDECLSGELVSNNGLRRHNGTFNPIQPEYRLSRDENTSNSSHDVLAGLAIAGGVVLIEAVGPAIAKFVRDDLYSYVSRKFREVTSREDAKVVRVVEEGAAAETAESTTRSKTYNTITFDEARQRAHARCACCEQSRKCAAN